MRSGHGARGERRSLRTTTRANLGLGRCFDPAGRHPRVSRSESSVAASLPVDESLLDFVGVAGDGIVGLEHREPALIVSQEIARKAFRAASAAASAR